MPSQLSRNHIELYCSHLAKAQCLIVHLDLVLNFLNKGNRLLRGCELLHHHHPNLCKLEWIQLGLKVGDEVCVDGDQLGLHAWLLHQDSQLDSQLKEVKISTTFSSQKKWKTLPLNVDLMPQFLVV